MKDYTSSELMDVRLSFKGIYKELDCVEQKMVTSCIRASVEKTDKKNEMKKLRDGRSLIKQILQAVKNMGIQALEEWRKKLADTEQNLYIASMEYIPWEFRGVRNILMDEEEMFWDAIKQAEETKRKRLVYMKQLHLMTDEDMEQTLKDINQAEEEKKREWRMYTEQAEEELRKRLVNTRQQFQLETEEERKKMMEDLEQLLLKAEDNEIKYPLKTEQVYVELKKLLSDNEQAEERRKSEWTTVYTQVEGKLIRTSSVYTKQAEKRKRIIWLSYIQQVRENRMKLTVYFEQVVEEWERDHPTVFEKVVKEWERDHPHVFEKVEERSWNNWLTNIQQSESERRRKWIDKTQLARKRLKEWLREKTLLSDDPRSELKESIMKWLEPERRMLGWRLWDGSSSLDIILPERRLMRSSLWDDTLQTAGLFIPFPICGWRSAPQWSFYKEMFKVRYNEQNSSIRGGTFMSEKMFKKDNKEPDSSKGSGTTMSEKMFKKDNTEPDSSKGGGTTMSDKMFKKDNNEPDSSKGGGTTMSENTFKNDNKEPDSAKGGGTTMSENMFKKDKKEPDSSEGGGTTMSEMFKKDNKELDSSKGGGTTMSETMFAVDNNRQDSPKGEDTIMSVIDMLLCKICYMNELDVVFLPCSHMVACSRCAAKLKCCAVCRADIKEAIPAYLR